MVFIGVVVTVDVIILGVLVAYEGGRTEATLFVNKEDPSDESGVSREGDEGDFRDSVGVWHWVWSKLHNQGWHPATICFGGARFQTRLLPWRINLQMYMYDEAMLRVRSLVT